MLFNSFDFIFVFLPAAVAGYYLIDRYATRSLSIFFLSAASLVFYAYWSRRYALLILASLAVNFLIARQIDHAETPSWRKRYFAMGIIGNLALLFYFKYTNFAVSVVNDIAGTSIAFPAIALPLGISFFTFQKIAYISDTYLRRSTERNFNRFSLFVLFFPQLIAGPIVHHSEVMPQFAKANSRCMALDLAVGMTIFSIGLAKKTLLADPFGAIATPYFKLAAQGHSLEFFKSWLASVAYSLQIYFDFSGYSDMAIGLARLFGIVLPINFASPYKAASIIDFWRRWHISLSRFLRDYLYIPLGGGHHVRPRVYTNIAITMLLGGFWHGAGWTFIIWGAIHATGIVINHLWRDAGLRGGLGSFVGWLMTFLLTVIAWVSFRADGMPAAVSIWRGMAGWNGVSIPTSLAGLIDSHPEIAQLLNLSANGLVILSPNIFLPVGIGLGIALFAPNTQTIMRSFTPGLASHGYPNSAAPAGGPKWLAELCWTPSLPFAIVLGLVFALGLAGMSHVSEFIYFNF